MGKFIRQLLPFGSLMLIVCVLAALRPDTFLTFDNFLNVLRRSSVYGIVAIGMTFVIISGGIDLSVGSMLAVCGMVGAWVMETTGGVAGTIAGVAAGLLSGDRKSTRLNSSHRSLSRMPSSA